MIGSSNQRQSAGDGSTNIQAQNIYITGVSESEARRIALDVYKANIEELSNTAKEIAISRAEKLTEALIERLAEKGGSLPAELRTPGMQLSILAAQRETARAGRQPTEELLVSLLVDRASESERTLRQIAIEEAIVTVPKLTDTQVDMLTANLLVNDNYYMAGVPGGLERLLHLLDKFRFAIGWRSPDVSHLEFTGCGRRFVDASRKTLDLAIRDTYPGLFQKPFGLNEFSGKVPDHELFSDLLRPVPDAPQQFTIAAVSLEDVNRFFSECGLPNEKKQGIFDFLRSHTLDPQKIRENLKGRTPSADFVFTFENHEAFALDLTPVGVAIASANFARKVGTSVAWPYHMRRI